MIEWQIRGRIMGFVAQDIDRSRWLWSVRYPAHRATNREDRCADSPHPQRFRYGHAASLAAAKQAANEAGGLPEPGGV